MFFCIPVLDFLSLFNDIDFLAQSFDFLILFITLLKIVLTEDVHQTETAQMSAPVC